MRSAETAHQPPVPRPSSPVPVSTWLKAFRLRTLPLAFSCIAMGSFLVGAEGKFRWAIFSLAVSTTLFLQILSNLANDYGDTVHGADSPERVGPSRTVQSGEITLSAMKKAMIVFALLALTSGIALLLVAFGNFSSLYPILFFLLGLGAIAAAIKYTAGDNPYGYKGLGDLFVFLFFGIVGVGGTYFLYTHELHPQILLPAASVGFLSAGVLNVNNMRDRVSDAGSGKITMVVRLGAANAKYYHLALISLAWIAALTFTLLNFTSSRQLLYLITFPLFTAHLIKVLKNLDPSQLDPQLKTLALSTFVYCITFGISQLIA